MIDKLKMRMQELGISPKRSMGQNFLIDGKGVSKIIQSVKSTGNFSILEVGPGLGALTDPLIELGRDLTLIELDRVIVEYWRSQEPNMRVIEGDALKVQLGRFG